MRREPETVTFAEVCQLLAKNAVYLSKLQQALGLYIPGRTEGYKRPYVCFLEKVVALRTFQIPLADIVGLFQKERRLLELMRFDALSDSPTWYLDACGMRAGKRQEDCLLLTEYCVGFVPEDRVYQQNLDFGTRADHLFEGSEMGEDVHRSLSLYRKQADALRRRIGKEIPVLQSALYWGQRFFRPEG